VIYSQADRYVVGPVEVTRKMPNWNPPASVQRGVYHGLIEVVIDERGLVEKAQVLISVAPTYDPLLIEAAKTWKFRPATLNGDPVKYRRQYEIILHPE
jgi:TonB family protein